MILLSQSAPPSWWLPSVQTTWMSSPSIRMTVVSKVPPPRS